MKIKGTFASQMSGKLGGLVAATSKGGIQYLRRLPSARIVGSALQNAVRSIIRSLSQAWSGTLDAEDRASWNTYAQNVTKLDSLGNTIQLSGSNWFVGNNAVRLQAAANSTITLTRVDKMVGPFNLGNPDSFLPGNLTIEVGAAGAGTLTAAPGIPPLAGADAAAGDVAVLYASTPYAPGRSYPAGPNNLVGVFAADGTLTNYTFQLPPALIATDPNQKQDFILRLSRADGRLSSPFRTTVDLSA